MIPGSFRDEVMDWTLIIGAFGVLGTFAGVAVALYAIFKRPASEIEEFAVEGAPWVRERMQGNYIKFLQLLLALDYASLEGLTGAASGDAATKSKVFQKSPETWSLVVARNREVVGYWSLFSLSDRLVRRVKTGAMLDSEITVDQVHNLTEPRTHTLYVEMFGIHPSYDDHRHKILRMLLGSLSEFVDFVSENNIEVAGVYANGFSAEGISLCEDFGMEEGVESRQGGHVYFLQDIAIAKRNLAKLVTRRRFPFRGI